MKSTHPELTQKFLTIVKIDSINLLDRIKTRQAEYLYDFSLKRERSVFKEIFFYRYKGMEMSDLAHLPLEIIELANDFYTHIDKLYWYLMHTQDMPNIIEEEIIHHCAQLDRKQRNLILYIDVELMGDGEEAGLKLDA